MIQEAFLFSTLLEIISFSIDIRILDKYGFTLTDQERNAILTHHKFEGFLTDPLRKCLSQADMDSTGKWKKANDPNYNSSFGKVLKNIGLTIISKL